MEDELTKALMTLLGQLGPVGRRKTMREIAIYLRKANKKRIQQNTQPDGSDMQQRADQRKGKMYRKLHKKMRYKATANSMDMGFSGAMGTAATNHQLGKRLQKRTRDGSTYMIDLPVRELLGLSNEDRQAIRNIIIKNIAL